MATENVCYMCCDRNCTKDCYFNVGHVCKYIVFECGDEVPQCDTNNCICHRPTDNDIVDFMLSLSSEVLELDFHGKDTKDYEPQSGSVVWDILDGFLLDKLVKHFEYMQIYGYIDNCMDYLVDQASNWASIYEPYVDFGGDVTPLIEALTKLPVVAKDSAVSVENLSKLQIK